MNSCFLYLFSELGKGIQDFSFSSRNWRKEFRFLFLLSKLGKKIRDFSFSSRDEAKEFGFLFLLSNVEKLFLNFSFSSRLGFFASRQWLFIPDICHFLTPSPFPAQKFDTKNA